MNWREMTPRERLVEKVKAAALAVAIGVSFAVVLVQGAAS